MGSMLYTLLTLCSLVLSCSRCSQYGAAHRIKLSLHLPPAAVERYSLWGKTVFHCCANRVCGCTLSDCPAGRGRLFYFLQKIRCYTLSHAVNTVRGEDISVLRSPKSSPLTQPPNYWATLFWWYRNILG